ncbi:BQ2448_925 [Microbotryum intermedium]|uniref:BQ2448_925 protein n=1 Tax=Microbotryum intermedium TaxID=269621 RepID=A0A238FA99_9BASI|nr:BQ2448_925 [Microbotryum intermedium]
MMNSFATSIPRNDRGSESQPRRSNGARGGSRSHDATTHCIPTGTPATAAATATHRSGRTSSHASAALDDGEGIRPQPSDSDQSSSRSSRLTINASAQATSSSGEAEHPSSVDLGSAPLFLAIDSSQKRMRAVVIDQLCRVVWTEEVNCDLEAPEYRTNQGCYRLNAHVCEPSEMRLKALDLLLEKIARECPDPDLLLKVRRVSGAGQQFTQHFLSSKFPDLLADLSERSESRMSTILSVKRGAFSLPIVATGHDRTTQEECRIIELALSDQPNLASQPPAKKGRARWVEEQARKLGQAAAAQRTGNKCWTGWSAAQLMKVANNDRKHFASEDKEPSDVMFQVPKELRNSMQQEDRRNIWERTSRVMLESSLLTTLFLGTMAPVDTSDACSTNLFNIASRDWDDQMLEIVMRQHTTGEEEVGRTTEAGELRRLLGPIVDGGITELGKINQYFVKRFNFSPDCNILPFSGDSPSTFLSYPLKGSREVIVCLGVGDVDTVIAPSQAYIPGPDHKTMVHPTPTPDEVDSNSSPTYVAEIVGRNGALGRSLARDLYCNGDWNTFARLVALSSQGQSISYGEWGGSVGLDDKKFMFWFSEGDVGLSSGRFVRCANGVRVPEFEDRKSNPRLLLESQFFSLRSRYSKLIAQSREGGPRVPPYDPLGFPPHDEDLLPNRIVAVGGACANPAMLSLLSTMFGCPVYMINALSRRPNGSNSITTSSALGAAHKAAYAYARSDDNDHQPETRSFADWLTAKLEDQARSDTMGREFFCNDCASDAIAGSDCSATPHQVSAQSPATHTDTDARKALDFASFEGFQFSSINSVDGALFTEEVDGSNCQSKGVDPPGLRLVAEPDLDEHRYYSCMLTEFIRVQHAAFSFYI